MNATANTPATLGVLQYYQPDASVSGSVTVPSVLFLGAVAQSFDNTINYGLVDPSYHTVVNGSVTSPGATATGGQGFMVMVGSSATTLFSGQNATTIYLNTNAHGAAFLGGGPSVIKNAFSFANINVSMDAGPGGGLGSSTLIVDDSIGGGATVTAAGGSLIQAISGGSDSIVGNGGTVVVEGVAGAGTAHGALTVSAASASTDLWVGTQGAPIYITPGAGNAFVFQGTAGHDNSATLFGGTRVFGGQTLTAAAYTGKTTVLAGSGYFESGSAGGSIMTTSTTPGAATLVAGGAGDILQLGAAGETANLGNGLGVLAATASVVSGAQTLISGTGASTVANVFHGETFDLGSGSGTAIGAQGGYNTFVIQGSGNYTVAGFHDLSKGVTQAGFLHGSLYMEASTAGGANITIVDFIPQNGLVFDQFDLGSRTATITSTLIGGSGASSIFNNTAVLSDGTTINFLNTQGTVHQQGTFIV